MGINPPRLGRGIGERPVMKRFSNVVRTFAAVVVLVAASAGAASTAAAEPQLHGGTLLAALTDSSSVPLQQVLGESQELFAERLQRALTEVARETMSVEETAAFSDMLLDSQPKALKALTAESPEDFEERLYRHVIDIEPTAGASDIPGC